MNARSLALGQGALAGAAPNGAPTATPMGGAALAFNGVTTGLMSLSETQSGEVPLARFGHTTTFMGGYQVILFGGAVGDNGRYTITNDAFSLDMSSLKWQKIQAENSPSARAAHAAACVDELQFVIYGGATGGGSLSTDELYLLDLRKQPLSWMAVPINRQTPGRRYGHTLVYHRPNLIVFGGNDGTKTLNDIWFMDVQSSPFTWQCVALPPGAKQPSPRVYHSAEICRDGPAAGMMVVFGGRTTESRSLRDAWGLRQHRDKRWDWVEAPIKKGPPPDARFQHTAVFFGSKMVVIGGRESDVTKALPTAVYDTEACEWRSIPPVGRFRHSSWSIDLVVYTFGGFDHRTQSQPTADLQKLDAASQPNYYSEKERIDFRKRGGLSSVDDNLVVPPRMSNTSAPHSRPGESAQDVLSGRSAAGLGTLAGSLAAPEPALGFRPQSVPRDLRVSSSPVATLQKSAGPPSGRSSDKVRISQRVHATIDNPDFSALVRKISIDRLEEEGKKIRGHTPLHHLQTVEETDDTLADGIIRRLLRPNVSPAKMEREFNSQTTFCVSWDEVSQLCHYTFQIIKQEPMVLGLRAPIKVYGDIHGQFYDLMRLFGSYKCPVEEDWAEENELPDEVEIHGDIDSIDYLFLGDFVDRGTNSLEVMCLLFALKCKYPAQVHLIRGNHEDSGINSIYGFKEECRRRLREDPDHSDSCWQKFNKIFEWLPVGALIEDKILCVHGGIGGRINRLQEISDLQRPLKVSQVPSTDLEQKVTDLLWSDPTDNDSIRGVIPNDTRDPDGSGQIVKFGPDRVIQFLDDNHLDLIIRAHECVMDGFERFAGGKLITLFSATDYCGHHRNAGALLFVRRDLTVVPKIIYPPDRDQLQLKNTWISVDRPPTPPRNTNRRASPTDLGF